MFRKDNLNIPIERRRAARTYKSATSSRILLGLGFSTNSKIRRFCTKNALRSAGIVWIGRFGLLNRSGRKYPPPGSWMSFLEKKWFKATVFIRRQVRPRLNRVWLSRSWRMIKRSSFGRSGSVASASESPDDPFEVFSAQANSKIAAILFTLTVGAGHGSRIQSHFGEFVPACINPGK